MNEVNNNLPIRVLIKTVLLFSALIILINLTVIGLAIYVFPNNERSSDDLGVELGPLIMLWLLIFVIYLAPYLAISYFSTLRENPGIKFCLTAAIICYIL